MVEFVGNNFMELNVRRDKMDNVFYCFLSDIARYFLLVFILKFEKVNWLATVNVYITS